MSPALKISNIQSLIDPQTQEFPVIHLRGAIGF